MTSPQISSPFPAPSDKTAMEELRHMVHNFNYCREGFLEQFEMDELVTLHRALLASEWDIYPDSWEDRQVEEALGGRAPTFDEEEQPTYDSPASHYVIRDAATEEPLGLYSGGGGCLSVIRRRLARQLGRDASTLALTVAWQLQLTPEPAVLFAALPERFHVDIEHAATVEANKLGFAPDWRVVADLPTLGLRMSPLLPAPEELEE